jgi:hypothetical protein
MAGHSLLDEGRRSAAYGWQGRAAGSVIPNRQAAGATQTDLAAVGGLHRQTARAAQADLAAVGGLRSNDLLDWTGDVERGTK